MSIKIDYLNTGRTKRCIEVRHEVARNGKLVGADSMIFVVRRYEYHARTIFAAKHSLFATGIRRFRHFAFLDLHAATVWFPGFTFLREIRSAPSRWYRHHRLRTRRDRDGTRLIPRTRRTKDGTVALGHGDVRSWRIGAAFVTPLADHEIAEQTGCTECRDDVGVPVVASLARHR
jgi:hypothetical protein